MVAPAHRPELRAGQTGGIPKPTEVANPVVSERRANGLVEFMTASLHPRSREKGKSERYIPDPAWNAEGRQQADCFSRSQPDFRKRARIRGDFRSKSHFVR